MLWLLMFLPERPERERNVFENAFKELVFDVKYTETFLWVTVKGDRRHSCGKSTTMSLKKGRMSRENGERSW